MGKRSRKRSRAEQMQDLYDGLPRLECKGLCQNSCGPIVGTRMERKRMTEAAGAAPSIDTVTLTCGYLGTDGRCTIYEVRPLICRLWGLVRHQMECEHGCVPSRWLSDAEGKRILLAAQALGGHDAAWLASVASLVARHHE